MIPDVLAEEAKKMIMKMTEAEIEWTTYIGKDQLGFSPVSIRLFVQGQANSVCKNLGFDLIYPEDGGVEQNPLKDLLRRHISSEGSITRSNTFVNNNATYVKGAGFQNDF